MAIIDKDNNSLVIQIVFDGAPLSGKTTSLRSLAKERYDQMTVETPVEQDGRTMYFDWAEYTGGLFKGKKIRCQLIAVPGQDDLNNRREFILQRADAIVLVMDSSRENFGDSLQHYQRLKSFLYASCQNIADAPIGVVVLANKQDLDDALSVEEIADKLNDDAHMSIIAAQANLGKGLREAFTLGVHLGVDRAQALIAADKLQTEAVEFQNSESLLKALQEYENDLIAHQSRSIAPAFQEAAADYPAGENPEPENSEVQLQNDELPEAFESSTEVPDTKGEVDASSVPESESESESDNNINGVDGDSTVNFDNDEKKREDAAAQPAAKQELSPKEYLLSLERQFRGKNSNLSTPKTENKQQQSAYFDSKGSIRSIQGSPTNTASDEDLTFIKNKTFIASEHPSNTSETGPSICYPNALLPSRMIWPQVSTRIWLHQACEREPVIEEHANEWVALYANDWHGRLRKTDIFPNFEKAQAYFHKLVRRAYRAAGVLSPCRFIAISQFKTTGNDFAVWQLCKYFPSIEKQLEDIARYQDGGTAVKELAHIVDLISKQLDHVLDKTGVGFFSFDDFMIKDDQVLSLNYLSELTGTGETHFNIESELVGKLQRLLDEKMPKDKKENTMEYISYIVANQHNSSPSVRIFGQLH